MYQHIHRCTTTPSCDIIKRHKSHPMIKRTFKLRLAIVLIGILIGIGYLGTNLFSRTTERQKTAIAVQGTAEITQEEQTALAATAPGSTDTAEWQEYTDKNFGFSLKFPAGWQTTRKDHEHPASIFTLTYPETDEKANVDIAVRVLSTPSFDALEKKLEPQAGLIKNKNMVTVNGQDVMAVTLGSGADSSLYVYFEGTDRLYNIIFYKAASMDALGDTEKRILGSFEISPQN